MEKLLTFAKSKKGLIVIGVIVLAVVFNALKSGCCSTDGASCDAPAAITE
tara:strand:- start:4410 stop:4559 length:150 start_codon:yes stop_codon:yes gene_type:complete